ncbi:MAG: hypothetical protein N2561_05570 [Bacteroidetes bacterium]|nr:hypothetical protein [Bacteroidota bacterium]
MRQTIGWLWLILGLCPFPSAGQTQNIEGLLRSMQWQKIPVEARSEYNRRWLEAYEMSGEGFYERTALDTMRTLEIRARLEAVFGPPTQTIIEILRERGSVRAPLYVQFEYWFMVDGAIPIVLLDVDGPFGRGLVYGGLLAHVDRQREIKRELVRLLLEAQPAPYVDYYYSPERRRWYRVGYDGQRYFIEPTGYPTRLERPQLQ